MCASPAPPAPSIPLRISYLTLLDTYNVIAIMAVVVVIAENFFLSPLYFADDDPLPGRVDRLFMMCFAGAWTALHLGITVGSYFRLFYSSWEEVEKKNRESSAAGHPEPAWWYQTEALSSTSGCHLATVGIGPPLGLHG